MTLKRLVVAVLLALMPALSLAQAAVTLSVTTTGGASKIPTLTWSSEHTTSCAASGGWSGTKATSGTETLPAVTASTTYTLTCSAPALSTAVVSWQMPTQNVDGTPVRPLVSTRIYRSSTAAGVPTGTMVTVPAPATTHTLTGLPAGTWHIGAAVEDSQGNISGMSNLVTRITWAASSPARSVTVVPDSPPRPPVLLSTTTTAWNLERRGWWSEMVAVGTIPLGAKCGASQVAMHAMVFTQIDPALVKPFRWNKPARDSYTLCG
jgi:hypothetical protein